MAISRNDANATQPLFSCPRRCDRVATSRVAALGGRLMERRLCAILAIDMVGYSRLMGSDEEATIARHKGYRNDLIDPAIAANGGRIFNTAGDGMLAEFASVLDALRAALSLQEGVGTREAGISDDQRIRYRAGVHMADIVVDGDDILGDGVNVAARIEALADPGGICITDTVHSSVRGRVDAAFEDMGEQPIKNMPGLRVWRWVRSNDAALPQPAATRAQDAEKPSIAVLPFNNMSGDVEQDYFADGMAEDIITELARMPWFFVIARNSSFTYKGRAVDVKAAGAELGAAYVVEGSVRKAGNRIRITAQLIDALSGNHVWAERYDRDLTDIFDIQDEITQAIVAAVAPQFVSAELKKSQAKTADQLGAWECVMRGRAHVWKLGREDNDRARDLFARAIALSPGGRLGQSDLSLVHFLEAFYGWGTEPRQSFAKMYETALRAVAVDDADPMALTLLAWAQNFNHRWDEAIATIDQAAGLSPNFVPAIGVRGAILCCADEPDVGIAAVDRALALSPRDGFVPLWLMAQFWAFHSLQDYQRGLAAARKAKSLAPDNPTFARQIVAAMHMLGDTAGTQAALDDYLRLDPKARVEDSRKIPSRSQQHLERYLQILREAGVPDGPA